MLIDGKEWRLVPVEPTEEMLDAAARASTARLMECINDPAKVDELGSEASIRETHASRFRSMLDAAPTPPAVQQASGQAAPSDEQIDEIFKSPPHLKKTLREGARALLSRYGQAPAASAEPVPVEIERLAINRYRPVPAGALAYKVVAGDGSRSLFSGTKDECQIVARKLTEAFLDGAHVAINAAPVAAQAPAVVNQSLTAESPPAQEPDEPLPPPGIHATVHYAAWLRREAHRHQEPKASVLRQTARMLDVLKAECGRLHQELIDAQAPAAAGDLHESKQRILDAVVRWHNAESPGRTVRLAPDEWNALVLRIDAELAPVAASLEPFAVLTVHKSGQVGMFADAQSVRLRPITDEDRRFYREQRGCELVEVFRAPVAAQAPASDYIEGVNVERLQRACRALGMRTDDSLEAFVAPATHADHINRLTTAVIKHVLTPAQAPAADGDALAEMVHAMFRSGNSVPVERITITRKQYDAAMQRTGSDHV